MKRLASLVSALAVIGVLAVLAWSGHFSGLGTSSSPQDQSLNLAPQALTSAEQTAFLSLVCTNPSGPAEGYAHQCDALKGYPSSDYGGAGLGLGITLQSVIYGHLTTATANEAYVTYAGSFEPHASNYGGGILFAKATDGWQLKGWYPGGQAGSCVVLTPKGRAHFVCLNGWEGQGEADSRLVLATLPPRQSDASAVLSARDLRETMTPNANCQTLQPGQGILLAISNLKPAPSGATAQINYVSAQTAQTACATSQLANAATTTQTLTLHWHDDHLTITPVLDFTKAP